MDIVERLRRWSAEESTHELLSDAADEIERLRGIINDDRLEGAADKIERLRKALQAVVDAHGTGQGIGAQGVGGWLDQARKALDDK